MCIHAKMCVYMQKCLYTHVYTHIYVSMCIYIIIYYAWQAGRKCSINVTFLLFYIYSVICVIRKLTWFFLVTWVISLGSCMAHMVYFIFYYSCFLINQFKIIYNALNQIIWLNIKMLFHSQIVTLKDPGLPSSMEQLLAE